MLVLVVAWAHAMIGLHFWLGVRPWYARLRPVALVVAVLVPVLSLLGAIEAGRQVIALAADPGWTREAFTLPPPETLRALETITEILSCFFAGVVAAVACGGPARPGGRTRRRRRRAACTARAGAGGTPPAHLR